MVGSLVTHPISCRPWIGFDDNKQLGLTGAEAALPAWVDFMSDAIALRLISVARTLNVLKG